jgi:hypothetical protein
VIVRLLGEGQYRVDDSLRPVLEEYDNQIGAAVAAGDESGLWHGLQALADAVRQNGTKLADDELCPSDAVIPPEDLALEEAQELLTNDGFIPDVPVST